jgi:GMP synthase-like glutamine amidotransferase
MDRIRLGLLQVNHDKSDTIGDHFPDDAHRFRDVFDEQDQRFRYRVYMTIAGELPADIDEQDAYLITGSPLSVLDDHAFLPPLYDFIRACHAARKPMIGACFGHQAIAVALGGRVERAVSGWNVGIDTTRFEGRRDYMQPLDDLNFYAFHEDQVTVLPEGAERIGVSENCENAAFVIGDHILTTQMHPEFNAPFMEAVLNECDALLGEQVFRSAKDSLNRINDGPRFAQWMTQFLAKEVRVP